MATGETRAGVGYQPQLDGIRAIAVLEIVVFHARSSWFPGGYVGVDIFFVLSGYLITSLLLVEHDRTGRIRLGRFYLRRALRLLPALAVVCAVVATVWLLGPGLPDRGATLLGAVAAISYTSSMLGANGTDLGWMIHTWSLSVEEYFYLVWPLVLILLTARGRRTLRWSLLVLLVAAIAYRFIAGLLLGWDMDRIAYAPDTRAEQLLLGCALAAVLPRLGLRIGCWAAVAAGAVLAAFVVMPAALSFPLYRNGFSTVVAVLAAVVITHAVRSPGSWVSRTLALPPLVWVGQRSYGIYLWNLPLVAMVAATPVPGGPQLAIKLLLTFVVPALSYRLVEQPFLRIKRRYGEAAPAKLELSPAVAPEPSA